MRDSQPDGSSSVTDFYRQRVLIPVRDDDGHVCGLVGRNVGDERWPKYKNPPSIRLRQVDQSLSAPPAAQQPQGPRSGGRRHPRCHGDRGRLRPERTGQLLSNHPVGRGALSAPGRLGARLHPNPPMIAFDGDAAGRESTDRVGRTALTPRCSSAERQLHDHRFVAIRGASMLEVFTAPTIAKHLARGSRRPPYPSSPAIEAGRSDDRTNSLSL